MISLIVIMLFSGSVFSRELTDYSGQDIIVLDEPSVAYVNITNVNAMPNGKTDNLHAWFEYRDDSGNYFKKRVILNAQGNSSLSYRKKNFKADFCEDEWLGQTTTAIQIGNWVRQDGFHFKANWLDTFRGGLSCATACKFYEDIVADEPRIQERAELEKFSIGALCHPDCFPCVVSLNGEFYGIFAWQLKKSRKNMDMEKNNPKHVHFELLTYTNSLSDGVIDWDDIEVKNPNVLTEESRGYIEHFARYHSELAKLSITCNTEQMRAEIGKRFDVAGFIDFIIHDLITANIDGSGKNIQFFTYDGVKWFCTPYDLDETFGTTWTGAFQFPPQWTWLTCDYRMLNVLTKEIPFLWFYEYFWNDVKSRYATLRDNGVISVENIIAHLTGWNDRIGEDTFKKEHEKWPDSPSVGSLVLNDGWESVDSWQNYSRTSEYSAAKTYYSGNVCIQNYHIWKAEKTMTGVPPIKKCGYTDSYERVRNWLSNRIQLEDSFLEYDNSSVSAVESDNRTGESGNGKLIKKGRIVISKDGHYYSIKGERLDN